MKYFVVYLPLQISKDSFTAGLTLFPRKQKVCGFRELFLLTFIPEYRSNSHADFVPLRYFNISIGLIAEKVKHKCNVVAK